MELQSRATAQANEQHYLDMAADLELRRQQLLQQAAYWRNYYDTWHEKNTLQSQTPDA